ncbi:MAG: hypothetical protein KGJ60_13320 [Verrucomicrobiota bacterium]|nr:hypothetical protein [Verrucomicrobiota bacterium]MDE3068510.1 hypothetical protein [Verrucomicrobiota bacterium]
MRTLCGTILGLWLCELALTAAGADAYSLNGGGSVTGDIVTFNDSGITFRLADDTYTNLTWPKFSQDSLKQLARNPKIKPLVDPFIETPPAALVHKAPIKIHEVSRLALPPKQSLIGALFSSSLGVLLLLLLYAANLYAAFEISIFRARPLAQVVGLAAILPVIGPVIFLSMPTSLPPSEETAAQEEAPAASFVVPGAAAPEPHAEPAAGGLHIAPAAGHEAAASHPQPQVFQRGQFTFNRRFFETKFSGFFGVTRRAAEKDLVLAVKTLRGSYLVQRITRIAANDIHFEIVKGAASQEVMVPFAEIQEIQLKHKDA